MHPRSWQLQEQSTKMNQNQMDELAAACLAMHGTCRGWELLPLFFPGHFERAIQGLNAASIAGMHQSMLAQSQTHSAQPWHRDLRTECSRPVCARLGV